MQLMDVIGKLKPNMVDDGTISRQISSLSNSLSDFQNAIVVFQKD
ncbi:hypothetical protein FACS189459_6420 [Bacilli bacterium]|nr:hypothetical protein FACS189459_6420 [Bacilli bacterium]GHU52199.1 hypothetical protein FACS189496_1940 [Bacilli bacterium]